MNLQPYKHKRNFSKTPEPAGRKIKRSSKNLFVVQKHHAGNLHYDFRLELDGVLKSWAIPKGPSVDPKVKRLAIEVEDHPVEYANFEGEIPEGEYGAGHVIVWDRGEWTPPADVHEQLKNGHLEIKLHGKKLEGEWLLIRTRQEEGKKADWLLIKRVDQNAVPGFDITTQDKSVLSGKTLEEIES